MRPERRAIEAFHGSVLAERRKASTDGDGRLELVEFHAPPGRGGDRNAPANTPGLRHLAFRVDDLNATVAGLRARGGALVGEVESYEDIYRLCYVRDPDS